MTVVKWPEYAAKFAMTAWSLFCLIAIPGAFVEAILLALIRLMICAVMAMRAHLQVALLNVFILSLALALSPTSDMDVMQRQPTLSLITLPTLALTFIGVAIGLSRLQHENKELTAHT